MHRASLPRVILSIMVLALPVGAQTTSTFSNYASPFTTEFPAAVGAPVTSGILDFYDTELFFSGARNVLGTWGTSPTDPGSVNRPRNIGSSTAMFATQLGEEIDIFGAGSDIILGRYNPFNIFSMAVGHLYSTAYSPIALAPITLTVFGFGPSTANQTIQQVFTIPTPPVIAGVQTPVLQTLVFDNRWVGMSNVWWNQGIGSGTAHQFTNVVAAVTPEPGTYALMLTGLICLGAVQIRRRRA